MRGMDSVFPRVTQLRSLTFFGSMLLFAAAVFSQVVFSQAVFSQVIAPKKDQASKDGATKDSATKDSATKDSATKDAAKPASEASDDGGVQEDRLRARLERQMERYMERSMERKLGLGLGRLRHGEDPMSDDAHNLPPPWTYPWYPWYPLPQSFDRKIYPPSITHTPALGLQHNYPFAYQMGLRVPSDADSLYVLPNLSPYVGVVGLAKAEAARKRGPSGLDQALSLIKEKKYKEGGKILADEFRDSEDPRYPLLLAEVFFALGKPAHAEVLLRQALESKDVEEALPEDIASHFATPEEFEGRLAELVASGENKLLTAYLQLHSKSPDQGLDLLQKLSKEKPSAEPAALLYRHYLGKVFKTDAKA